MFAHLSMFLGEWLHMSIIYSKEEMEHKPTSDGAIAAYRKWFDMNGMDFEIQCRDNRWSCSAWFRNKWGGAVGDTKPVLIEAIHSCYVDARSEVEKPTVRKRNWFPA